MKEIMERLLEATDCGTVEWEKTGSYLSFSVEFEEKLYLISKDHKGETEIYVMNDEYDFVDIGELKNTDILKKIYNKILHKYPDYKKRVEDCLRRIEEDKLKTEIDITQFYIGLKNLL